MFPSASTVIVFKYFNELECILCVFLLETAESRHLNREHNCLNTLTDTLDFFM
jgi:ssRNA-specific RNase YbeY (16S rRNA maturation enzyme)